MSHHGKPTDIYIHLQRIGQEAPTQDKPWGEAETEFNQMDDEYMGNLVIGIQMRKNAGIFFPSPNLIFFVT
jgi:hypothetical protein